MPIEVIEKEISGRKVSITQFAGVRGMKLQARLFKLVLPVIGAFAGGAKDGGVTKADLKFVMEDNIDLQGAFRVLADTVDPESLYLLMRDLLASTAVDGRVIDSEKVFNDLFTGNYALAYQLAFETAKANNFFDFGSIGNLLFANPTNTTGK